MRDQKYSLGKKTNKKEKMTNTYILFFFLLSFSAEDNLNVSMKEITVTARDGQQSKLETVYIRGSMIRFIIVPDLLQQAPMFKRVGPNAMKGRGIGSARGRATIMRGMLPISIERESRVFFFLFNLHKILPPFFQFQTAQNRRGRGGGRGGPPPSGPSIRR